MIQRAVKGLRRSAAAAPRRYTSQRQHVGHGSSHRASNTLDEANWSSAMVAKRDYSGLVDQFGRSHTYLRVSLTEKCNLRCLYCMPEEGVHSTNRVDLAPPQHLLTADEIFRLCRVAVARGVTKIRLTGGEPLVRPDFNDVFSRLGTLRSSPADPAGAGLQALGITTNALTLEKRLAFLQAHGLTSLNISLDTLVPAKFELITRRPGHGRVMRAIDAAVAQGIDAVKINCVVMRGVNDDELVDFCRLTSHMNVTVRFIEYMPFDGNRWSHGRFVSYAEMKARLGAVVGRLQKLDDDRHDTCKHYQVDGHVGRIGFITSMSEHFCAGCNRLRLTADGQLKVCLFGNAEVSLRDMLRDGASDEEIGNIVAASVRRKEYALGGKKDMLELAEAPNRPMIKIGG